MKFKNYFLIICIIISLFCIANVFATDNNDTVLINENQCDELIRIENQSIEFNDEINFEKNTHSSTDELLSQNLNDENALKEAELVGEIVLDGNLNGEYKISNNANIEGNGHYINSLLIESDKTVILKNIIFKENPQINTKYVTFKNCTFMDSLNTAISIQDFGNYGPEDIKFIDCKFLKKGFIATNTEKNTAKITIDNCSFNSNFQTYINLKGRYFFIKNCNFNNFVYITTSSYETIISNCNFTNTNGSSYILQLNGAPTIEKCNFINCSSSAIYHKGSGGKIKDCNFINCISNMNGGAINTFSSIPLIENCLFMNNKGSYEGAIYCSDYTNLKINNCTFINNTASYVLSGYKGEFINSTFINNKISGSKVIDCNIDEYSLQGAHLSFELNPIIPDVTAKDTEIIVIKTPSYFKESFIIKVDNKRLYTNRIINYDSKDQMELIQRNNQTIIKISNISGGVHSLHIEYPGDNVFNKYSNNVEFEATRLKATGNITFPTTIFIGDELKINVSINNDIESIGVYYTYKLNGYPTYELENTYKLTDGKAIITMPSGVIGEKTIVFSTDENDPDYELKILSKKINVTKFHSEIHVKNVINETYGEIIDLTPSIHEIYNERYIRVQNGNVITRIMRNHPILTGYINIYNGNDLLTKVKINSEGILDYSCEKYLLSNLNAGEYQIKYVYNGDDYFNSCEKTILLNISKLNQPSTYNIMNNIEGETVTLSYFIANSATGKYHLTIPDYYDKSGKLYNGGIEVSIPNILNSGKYNCIFYYYGDENYEGTNITHQLTIKSKLYSENISYDFNNLNTDTSSFLIKLPEETSGKIILKINNENYEFEVVNGLCNIKLPTLTNGNYQYTLSYLGNDDYAPFTITNTLNINKPTTKPNTPTTTKILLTLKNVKVKKSAKKLILQAILKQGNNPLKSKKIIFKFNGKKYAAKTNKKGVAKVTIKKKVLKKLKVGKKVRYQASYGEITVKKSVKVKK